MLDIAFIRENSNRIKENCTARGLDFYVDHLLRLDEERRGLIHSIETKRSEQKQASKEKPDESKIKELKKLSEEIKKQEEKLRSTEEAYQALLWQIPNLLHEDTPIGKDESGNVVVREVGKRPTFSFTPQDHEALGEALGIINKTRAAEISGARFAFLMGGLVRLQFALVQLVLETLTDEKQLRRIAKQAGLQVTTKPFIPVVPPVMMRPEVMHQMGRLEPRDERYHLAQDDLYLVGSAEHTLGPLHMGETIAEQNLPLRYLGYSTAFRREAGSYGKDTKGIIRLHQFDKLEIESFTTPAAGLAEQDFIIAIQEYLMKELDIPYRLIRKCSGDMGAPDYREFDIEAWMPGQDSYRETHTSDYMTDYQARRLNTKVRYEGGDTDFVHMNDATVFAIGRTLVAIMENNQQADGSIIIPKALRRFVGLSRISSR